MIDESTIPGSDEMTIIDWQAEAAKQGARAEAAEERVKELEAENAALRQGKSSAPVKKLSSYQLGEQVEVVALGEWFPGVVNGVEHKLHLVYVHTERGPVTVASDRGIRPLPKN